jgi:hypothetical protein
MALCTNEEGLCVVAVEAKVDEDFGPLLGEKKAAASDGQSARIKYLESLLGVHFEDSIRYQLLHRTASALLTAREFHAKTAVMLVQSFGSRSSLKDDFMAFCFAIKAEQVSPCLYHVPSFQSPQLFLGWCRGDEQFLKVDLPSAL